MSNITQWQNSRNESFLFVGVEKGCTDIYLAPFQDIISEEVTFYSQIHNDWSSTEIDPATYTLILDVDNATEEQLSELIPNIVAYGGGIRYPLFGTDAVVMTATESMPSLVRSLNLDPNYNYVVLKIEK